MIDLSITIMKRSVINLIAILLFCNVQLVRAEDVDNCYLCIQGSSGEEQSFPIDEINKITFSPDAMVIHLKGDVEDVISYEDILCMIFEEYELSEVDAVQVSNELCVLYHPELSCVDMTGENIITLVQLFDLQGKLLHTSQPYDFNVTIDMGGYPTGVYIVKAVCESVIQTFKFIKY